MSLPRHNTAGADRPGLLARCWAAQQHTVDRGDVNRFPGPVPEAAITAAGDLFPLVLRRYD